MTSARAKAMATARRMTRKLSNRRAWPERAISTLTVPETRCYPRGERHIPTTDSRSFPMTPLTASLAILGFLFTVASAHADPIYCWHDADEQLHCSNRVERVPPGAKVASPPPLGHLSTRRIRPLSPSPTRKSRPSRERDMREQRSDCPPAQPTRVGEMIAKVIDPEYDSNRRHGHQAFTLFVDGEPMMYRSGARLQAVAGIDANSPSASLKDASLAFPSGSRPCMGYPPLEAYPVRGGSGTSPNGLCSDFRRAFAQVGITANRDDSVLRSLRAVAKDVAEAAAKGYFFGSGRDVPMHVRVLDGERLVPLRPFVRPRGRRAEDDKIRRHYQHVRYSGGRPVRSRPVTLEVPAQTGRYGEPTWSAVPKRTGARHQRWVEMLPPTVVVQPRWLVDAHAVQTAEIAAETEAFVDELTIALEEIDRAARAAGCW